MATPTVPRSTKVHIDQLRANPGLSKTAQQKRRETQQALGARAVEVKPTKSAVKQRTSMVQHFKSWLGKNFNEQPTGRKYSLEAHNAARFR
ncbi:hypothetical protein TrLO_g8933 [Triparma laevis f. longispina]|uniref:Uncharacterized protein n=1 Tax=Triparma laevis f. longispina TaxID=1714387 RepID=A0A9W7FUF8_9STRA|nr:hypothetical protein TrLO_g8933 [Triparma laevis f. longispina]